MRQLLVLAFVALAAAATFAPVSARPRPSPAPSATPTAPPEIPSVRKAAISQIVSWQAGILDRTRYSADFNKQITDDHVNTVSKELGQLGSFDDATFLGLKTLETAPPGVISYLYQMKCSRHNVYELISLDQQGKIAGIVFLDSLDSLNPPTPTPSPE